MSMKNPLTLAGIEPVTFRFVAQHLNHCATAVPNNNNNNNNNNNTVYEKLPLKSEFTEVITLMPYNHFP